MADIDIRPAVAQLARVLEGVPDDGLDGPTPCEGMTLGQLIGHVDGFAQVFTLSARKDLGEMTATPPAPDDADLGPAGSSGPPSTSPSSVRPGKPTTRGTA